MRPRLVEYAPVKAPFSYPKSSDSINEEGIAGQVTLTQAQCDRLDRACSDLANTSLPVPLSPCKRTGTVVSATRCSLARAAAIMGDRPKITSIGGRSRESTNSVVRARGIVGPNQNRLPSGFAIPAPDSGNSVENGNAGTRYLAFSSKCRKRRSKRATSMECSRLADARICTRGYSLTTFGGEIDATFRKQTATGVTKWGSGRLSRRMEAGRSAVPRATNSCKNAPQFSSSKQLQGQGGLRCTHAEGRCSTAS